MELHKLFYKENIFHVNVFRWKYHERKLARLYLIMYFSMCLVWVLGSPAWRRYGTAAVMKDEWRFPSSSSPVFLFVANPNHCRPYELVP